MRIQSIEELARGQNYRAFRKIPPPLITTKFSDYKLLKQAYDLMLNNEHLKEERLRKFVGIKISMNTGLSPELKKAFSEATPVKISDIKNKKKSRS